MGTTNGVARHRPAYRWPAPAWGTVATMETDLACQPFRQAGLTRAEQWSQAERKMLALCGRLVVAELSSRSVSVALTPSGGVRIASRHGRRRRAWAEGVLSRHAAAVALYLGGV